MFFIRSGGGPVTAGNAGAAAKAGPKGAEAKKTDAAKGKKAKAGEASSKGAAQPDAAAGPSTALEDGAIKLGETAAATGGPAKEPAPKGKTFLDLTLQDPDGKPLANTKFIVIGPGLDKPHEGVTDAGGKARVDGLTAKAYMVSVPEVYADE